MGVAIGNPGKVCSRYNCYKRHREPWYVEEGGDTDYIIHNTGKVLFSIREPIVLPCLIEVAARYEEACASDQKSDNNHGVIAYLRFITVPLARDD